MEALDFDSISVIGNFNSAMDLLSFCAHFCIDSRDRSLLSPYGSHQLGTILQVLFFPLRLAYKNMSDGLGGCQLGKAFLVLLITNALDCPNIQEIIGYLSAFGLSRLAEQPPMTSVDLDAYLQQFAQQKLFKTTSVAHVNERAKEKSCQISIGDPHLETWKHGLIRSIHQLPSELKHALDDVSSAIQLARIHQRAFFITKKGY